jgi:ribosome-associated heat shock protein Hsp15
MAEDVMRLDRFLWFARIVKTRSFAQSLATAGHLRLDGRPIDRAAAPVRVGSVLTFATHLGQVRAIRVLVLPSRRGPPVEGSACYEELVLANVSHQAPDD